MKQASIPQMRAFEAVARIGSFSKAADYLNLSQSTVSAQVQQLEALAHKPLLIRNGHQLSLTHTGEELLTKARLALKCFDDVQIALSVYNETTFTTLSVGISASRLLIPQLTQFKQLFPDIKLITQVAPSGKLKERIRTGSLDIASISATHPPIGFHALKLAERRLTIYGKKGDALLQKGKLTLSDLKGKPLISWDASAGTRQALSNKAIQQGIDLDYAIEVDNSDIAYALAATGSGYGVAIEGELYNDPHLDVAYISLDEIPLGQYLITDPTFMQLRLIQVFFSFAKETLAT